jgi:murein DD-endopeptidase MepM/ murein hydrolase activator NlpD
MNRVVTALVRVLRLVLVVVLSAGSVLLGPASATVATGDADPVGEWPLRPAPEVAAGFDPPTDPWGAGHRGVDLLGSVGQPVRAALPGQVTFSGLLAGRGVVVVGHGPTRTTYEPVAATRSVGDHVAAGEPIGHLELVGSHCFPRACLHWGWIRGETYLDPLDLVGAGPVRLLPLWRTGPVPASTRAAALPAYSDWRPLLRLLRTGGGADGWPPAAHP